MITTRAQLLFAFVFLLLMALFFSHLLTAPGPVAAFSGGPPPSRTGAPGEGICVSCHFTFPLNDPSGGIVIDGLPEFYTLGEPIEFTVTVFQDGTGGVRRDWGFQLTVLDANDLFAGTLVATDKQNTQIIQGDVDGSTRFYIGHTFAGIFFNPEGADSATWTMTWIPPDEDVGPVTFYVAGNAANGNFTEDEDYIFSGSQTVLGPGAKAARSSLPAPARDRLAWQRHQPVRPPRFTWEDGCSPVRSHGALLALAEHREKFPRSLNE